MSPHPGFLTRAAKTHLGKTTEARPLSLPILQTTNFELPSSRALRHEFQQRSEQVYARFGHPTAAAAAARVARLEGAEEALVFSSGMAAITTSLFTVLRPGDHVVAQRAVFAQTFTFLDRVLREWGVDVEFVDASRVEKVEQAVRPSTKLIYVESPSNPLLMLVDIEAVARKARDSGALLFVDGTFATPYLQEPLALGASLSLHSGSKYLGGHCDVMCGVVAGSSSLVRPIRETHILLGGILDPHAAWLLMRGLKTLGLRMAQATESALRLARFLERQPGIRRVHYPWLESSPDHDLALRQMCAGGAVVSFEVAGGAEAARAFTDALSLIPVATSLGGVETMIEIPYDLDFGDEQLGEAAGHTGIPPGLLRLAVGIEDQADLEADLMLGVQALEAVVARRRR